MPSEEVKYEECEKMSLDSEEGGIISKATIYVFSTTTYGGSGATI